MSEQDSRQASWTVPVSLTGNTESQPISGVVAEQLCQIHGPKKLKLCKGEGLFTAARYRYPGEWLVWLVRLLFGLALVRLFLSHQPQQSFMDTGISIAGALSIQHSSSHI